MKLFENMNDVKKPFLCRQAADCSKYKYYVNLILKILYDPAL